MELHGQLGNHLAPALTGSMRLRILALVSVMIAVAVLTFVPPSANDFWLQARIGQLILDTGSIPHTVLFAFTEAQDKPFNAHEWLPSIVFHLLDRALGYDRLVFAMGAFGLLLFGLGARLAWLMTRSLGASILLGLCAILIANYRHHLRPELFALGLLLALALVLVTYQQKRHWPALLWSVPIALIWANSHGSFLVGPILAALFAGGEAAQAGLGARAESPMERLRLGWHAGRPYVLVAAAMALASCVNPLGVSLLHFALTLSTSEVTKAFINEWNPTLTASFMTSAPFVLFAAGSVATVVLAALNRRKVRVADVLIALAFGALALQRTRFVALFGFMALIVCARSIGPVAAETVERKLLVAASAIAVLTVAMAGKFGNAYGAYPFYSASHGFTEPMLQRLADPKVQGNVFSSYELGAELIYRAWPRLQPSIDSRIDSYGDEYFLAQHQMLLSEPHLRQFLYAYNVRYMLLLWRDAQVIKTMEGIRNDGWKLAFGDHKMVLLERTPRPQGARVTPEKDPK